MACSNHSPDVIRATTQEQREAVGVNSFPNMTRAQQKVVIEDEFTRTRGWVGWRMCGNAHCAKHIGPGFHKSRCCRVPKGGGGSGTTQSPMDVHIANQKAVDEDEVKIIGHIKARHGEVVKDPSAPLSPWARLAAAWKIVWTGTVQRAAPIEVEVPSGTLPACITVRASPFSSFCLL